MPTHVVNKTSRSSLKTPIKPSGIPRETPPLALIRSLGPVRYSVSEQDCDEVLTMGTYPLELIPRLVVFKEALTSMRLRHLPVPVRYARNATTPILNVAHAECRLESASQQALLQQLFRVRELTSYEIEVPGFGAGHLRKMRARHLKDTLTMRGELPSIFQFLFALDAADLDSLAVSFHRNLYEAYLGRGRDFAYELELAPDAYWNLRTVRLLEAEEYPRYSALALADALGPLLTLRHLEDVELRVEQSPLRAPDRDVAALARAWPHLRRLVLACTRCPGPADAPTLGSLHTLARACPGLLELVLPRLDFTDRGEPAPVEPKDGEVHHPLRVFGVACDTTTRLPDADAVRVARCVDSLFPNIDMAESWRNDGSVEALLTDWYIIWVNVAVAKLLRRCAPGRAYLD